MIHRLTTAALVGLFGIAVVSFAGFDLVDSVRASHQLHVVGGPCDLAGNPVTVAIDESIVRPFGFFNPELVSIATGQVVHWDNQGALDHTSTHAAAWDSGTLNPGEHYDVQFCDDGPYAYFCSIHGFTARVYVDFP